MMSEHGNDAAVDSALGALLSAPPSVPDSRFTARVMALVDADRRLAAARRLAWRRFAIDALAAGAIAAALLVLVLTRLAGGGMAPSPGPALAGMLALFAWLAAGQGAHATG